jgi:hypothetical protein
MLKRCSHSAPLVKLIVSDLFLNKHVTINAHGFRGPLYDASKGKKIACMVGLGDPLMFGWGVSDEEYYLALLSKYLNQSLPLVSNWEIINTAVPGYNTVMEVETLKVKALHYSPDLVIIDFLEMILISLIL